MTLSAPALSGTTWTLVSLNLGGASIRPGRLLVKPSFRLSGTTLTGSTGCSPLKAHVRLRGQAIVFRDIDPGSSDRCPDHALSLREDFTSVLARVTRYEVRGQTLTLSIGSAQAGMGSLILTASDVRP